MKLGNHARPSSPPLRLALAAIIIALGASVFAQNPGKPTVRGHDRDRGHEMLDNIKEDLKKNYYDPTFRGIDLDARFKAAHERVKKATSNGEIFGVIAQLLVDLDDSHTYFLPPDRVVSVDYGWDMQMIGDKCYVVEVKAGSDAEAQGLKVGDEVWAIDGYGPTRENLWKIIYTYHLLKPRGGMSVVVQQPDGTQREFKIKSKALTPEEEEKERKRKKKSQEAKAVDGRSEEDKEKQREKNFLSKYHEIGGDLFIWKIPDFELSNKESDQMVKKLMPFKAVVLDLRNNGGGAESVLQRLLGSFFPEDVNVGDIKRRKETKRLVAKTRGADRVYLGKLVVLVDSNSASAAEVFARTVQLNRRGTVVGDRTAGAVMRGVFYSYAYVRGPDAAISLSFYGVSITDADLVMSDGRSLEKTGVVPDELLLPTSSDLAARRDPVLSRAAALLGVELDPAKAGALFPRDKE